MPGKMYTDFLESAPIRKPCPNGPEGATRLYVEVTCPQCNKVFVDIPSESLRTCKASRCKRHLDRVHANHANHANSNPPQAAAPNAPPAAATTILNACCEHARRPLEDRIEALREEGRRASEEAEQRHRELLDELRAANRTRDAIAATVASPFKIAPPDAVTVGLKLPEKIHFHLKRMEDLQAANALFGSQLEAVLRHGGGPEADAGRRPLGQAAARAARARQGHPRRPRAVASARARSAAAGARWRRSPPTYPDFG